MTQEDKQLLLKDLCARLPYGVKVNAATPKGEKVGTIVTVTTKFIYSRQDPKIFGEFYVDDNDECFWLDFGLFKPYLRPMSSMTEKEKKEHDFYCGYKPYDENIGESYLTEYDMPDYIDFLYEHHLDFRGLIPTGLAIEAPSNMYKTE